MPTAREWAERVAAVAERQDRRAFTEIFDHFVPRLEAYLLRLGLDAAAAEEITQDVMLTLWRKAAMFDPAKSSLATWLYRIARNRRIDHARANRIAALDVQGPEAETIADDTRIEEDFDRLQRDDAVRALMRSLPEEQLRLVTLAFFDGLSQSEIADKTGIPLGTVKSRLRLAFNRLRKGLEAEGIAESG